MRCTASKSKHNFNFFGISKIKCFDYIYAGYNYPELGYKSSEHFHEQANTRKIARNQIENALVRGQKLWDKESIFKFQLGKLFVVANTESKTLITCYKKD